jgi:lysozyme
VNGIDVSEYQGDINWAKVKTSGIGFAYIRAGVGITTDKQAKRNLTVSKLRGVPRGVYIYFKPELDVARQAKILLDAHVGCELVPMIDVEHHGNLTPKQIVAALTRLVTIVERAVGKPPVIYTGKWFWDARVKSKKFGRCPLWVSQYVHYSTQSYKSDPVPVAPAAWGAWARLRLKPAVIAGWSRWSAWQFSAGFNGVGRRYGMQSADLDLNVVPPEVYRTLFV